MLDDSFFLSKKPYFCFCQQVTHNNAIFHLAQDYVLQYVCGTAQLCGLSL